MGLHERRSKQHRRWHAGRVVIHVTKWLLQNGVMLRHRNRQDRLRRCVKRRFCRLQQVLIVISVIMSVGRLAALIVLVLLELLLSLHVLLLLLLLLHFLLLHVRLLLLRRCACLLRLSGILPLEGVLVAPPRII